MGLECGWRHVRKRCSWEFEDFPKESVEIWPWRQRVEFSTVAAVVKFFVSRPAEINRDLKHHEICRTLGVGSDSMVTLVWLAKTLKNCASLLVSKNRSQEINKPFVPETIVSTCICIYVLHLCMYCITVVIDLSTVYNTLTLNCNWSGGRLRLLSSVECGVSLHYHYYQVRFDLENYYHIYQPLRSGRVWHKVNF